jgi:hypothetical protein
MAVIAWTCKLCGHHVEGVMKDLKNETVPGPARPETAETGAPNPQEGAIAP